MLSRLGVSLVVVLAACATAGQPSDGAGKPDPVMDFITAPFWDKPQMLPIARLIRQGAINDVADSLVNVWQPSADPAHNRLVRELLIGLGRWEDLRRLMGATTAAAEMLTALASMPPEQYAFHDSHSSARLAYSNANTPTVEVEIAGAKHYFWLDTGTGISVLGSDLANELGITPVTKSKASVRTVTGRLIDAAPAVITSLKVGALEARNHHVLIIDTKELQVESLWGLLKVFRIEGILGWNFVEHADLEFDMRKRQLSIRKPGKPHKNGRNLVWLGWPYVVTRGPTGADVVLGLDTGSSLSFVTPELITAAGIPILGYRETSLQGVGGVAPQIIAVASTLQLDLGSERLTFDSISVHEFTIGTLLKPQGVLGADVMNWGKLRLDWAEGKVTLKPYARPHKVLPKTPVPVQ